MLTLQQKIQQFDQRTQQFADLLNLTVEQVLTLKEEDTVEGNHFYAVYMSFVGGIHPSKTFINKYNKSV